MLTIHFPKLRLVWSPSPYATAQLFGELKQGKHEPDPVQAAALGSNENSKELESIADQMNSNIYDFLLKLPGITTRNIYKVMMKVKNLKELIRLNMVRINIIVLIMIKLSHYLTRNISTKFFFDAYFKKQLTELLGNESNAKMLWEIFHVAHKPVEADSNEKHFLSKFKRGKGKRF